MRLTDYHAKYYAHELTKRCSSDSLEKLTTSLLDAQVDLNPHQVDAALFAFKSPFSTGAILADEVGLGKTIEAGIVLAQKWAEQKRTILVIVPSSLRNQWGQELADKFFIPSEILEAKNFNRDIKNGRANPFVRDTVVICSYHFARNKADLVSQVRWDLVVIDEAHRLRNVYKAGNKIARAIYHNWQERHQGTDRISGSRTADQRAAIVDYFRNEAEIMIATEAAAEGINLQFCSLVVNYDLPWNPQRIEQRIGRCHRYGQQHDVVVVNFLNKHNAADQRVFELLSEKFALFSGVFGASDEVLGSIESGVDFEKRILGIYQTCRTPEEIQLSFDQLQAELGGQIDEKMQITRQRLLENFDQEVHEKLKVNLHESTDYLNRYERMLWNLTCHALESYADFAPDDHVFTLQACPEGTSVPVGKYRMGKNVDDAHHYRFNHPLAQHLMGTCAQASLPTCDVTFAYSETPTKVSILEPLNGQEGWMRSMVLRIESLEAEDHVLLAGATDTGQDLTPEQCQRLFNIPAEVGGSCYPPKEIERTLDGTLLQLEKDILQANAERNAGFFDTEMSKLERWAQDVKTSLEIRLKQLDVEIKTRKAEARKMVNLQEKVKAHREIKDLEKQRSEMRLSLYQAQDDVDAKKEGLLEEIEARLSQSLSRDELFTIRWRMT